MLGSRQTQRSLAFLRETRGEGSVTDDSPSGGKGMASGDDRQKAIDMAVSQIERSCGKGAIMRLGEGAQHVEIGTISSGCLSLDLAWHWWRGAGRITEIFGRSLPEKPPLPPHHSRGSEAGGACGIHRRRARPGCALREEAGSPGGGPPHQPAGLWRAGPGNRGNSRAQQRVDVIVIDSVAALVPKAGDRGEMETPTWDSRRGS